MLEQYEIRWKDYYATLGVSSTAEPEVIKAAYNALARKYHPDAGGNSERMKDINEAYEVLSDTSRRALYHVVYQQKQAPPRTASRNESGTRHEPRRAGGEAPRKTSLREEKIFPWPSRKWQRIALFCSFPIALILLLLVHHGAAVLIGLIMLVAASYACIKTRCLNKCRQGGLGARVAGGFAIVMATGGIGLAAIGAALLLAIPGLLIYNLFCQGEKT
jgi:hypothetical protein